MNITVVGAARSGLAVGLLAKKKGHNVFISENRSIADQKNIEEQLIANKIEYEFGVHSEKAINNCNLLITSPGVPRNAQIIRDAEQKNISIISELEFAWQHCENPVIAVTGTNGKTTTTSLITHILNHSGKKAVSAGNIGNPLSNIVDNIESDVIIVAEVSSYQLDRVITFKPDVAIILNITPDHLAYHGSMENYAKTKFRIAANQDENNLLILNADDELLSQGVLYIKGSISFFSTKPVNRGIYCRDEKIWIKDPNQHKEEELMLLKELSLPGIHNAYNSMAAAMAARAFEITNEDIRDSLMTFEGVEHRLEFVRTIDGVDFINDSKATNINATWYALSSYSKPIIWIAGGRGDSNDYSKLDELIKKNVKCIIAIGEEQDSIFNYFSNSLRCRREASMENAVISAKAEADEGDIVLLTPACKSFDMFVNYEHRGEVFKDIVNKL